MTPPCIDQYYPIYGPDWRRGSAIALALLLHGVIIVGMWQWAAASAQSRPSPQLVFTVMNVAESPATTPQSTPPVKRRLETMPATVPAPIKAPRHTEHRVHKAAAAAPVIEDPAQISSGSRRTAVVAPQTRATVAKQTLPDTAPVYLDQPSPPYPSVARRRGLQGVVLLTVEVAADGTPLKVAVLRSSGHAVLDDAARAAVHHWRFRPARYRGQSVRASVQVPIRFHLNGSDS